MGFELALRRGIIEKLKRCTPEEKYVAMANFLNPDELRSQADFDKCVEICNECSGGKGICFHCGCPYQMKLVDATWECAEGKF